MAAGPQAEPDDVTPAAASPERLLPPPCTAPQDARPCGEPAPSYTHHFSGTGPPVLAEETAVSVTAAAAVPGAHENGPGLEHLISCQY